MINGINRQKNFETSIRKNAADNPIPAAQKNTQSVLQKVPVSAAAIAARAGLPADKLSSRVISFARFFSIPLKPALLADIRRASPPDPSFQFRGAAGTAPQGDQSTSVKTMTETKPAADIKTREAFALAAAAAESKGVELQQKGLAAYTYAIDPYSRRQDEQQRGQKNKNHNRQEEKTPVKKISVNNTFQPAGGSSEYDSDKFHLTSDAVKNMFLEYARKNPLVNILNGLPGKNGQRWIIIPFDFSKDRLEFRVSMRILLNDEKILNNASIMALDIYCRDMETEDGEKKTADSEKRYLLLFESVKDKPAKLTVYHQHELTKKEELNFIQTLEKTFDIPPEKINIKLSGEAFPYEAGYGEDSFVFIDEEA